MKILLIEDDLDLGNGVRIALADQGFDVIWVRRKEDALHQLELCVPELILLDLGLPDGDGMSLMTRLRQQLKGVPVIILTARGTLQDRLCGLEEVKKADTSGCDPVPELCTHHKKAP